MRLPLEVLWVCISFKPIKVHHIRLYTILFYLFNLCLLGNKQTNISVIKHFSFLVENNINIILVSVAYFYIIFGFIDKMNK